MSVIELSNVSKKFNLRRVNKFGGTVKDGTIDVLTNFNLKMESGFVYGIAGRNGSGKSTLLKLLSGLIKPDGGTIKINGKIVSILELGIGFDPEMSGYDNIYYKCSMYGISDSEIDNLTPLIASFSELGDQLYVPVKTYSSGMKAKLAFSILIHMNADVMLIDEVLSVSDASFKTKCKMVFNKIRKEKKIVVIASHDLGLLEDVCDKVCWIDRGTLREFGDAATVCYHFVTDLNESPSTLRSLMENGNVDATYKLGKIYLNGTGVEQNITYAKECFQKASDMGSTDAMIDLSDILKNEGDVQTSEILLKKALSLGNMNAVFRLYLSGDDCELEHELNRLASSGNMRAIITYADALYSGSGVSQDYISAFKWYSVAADNKNIYAIYKIGIMYRDGIGVDKDIPRSLEMLTLSANMGYSKSMNELSNMYRRGIGVDRDIHTSIDWLKKLAEVGDIRAIRQIISLLNTLDSSDSYRNECDLWFETFANRSKVNVEQYLGDILSSSYESENDRKMAVAWYKKSADGGNPTSMYRLGVCYRDGIGVEPDLSCAYGWFEKASAMLNVNSMVELGLMLLKGIGVPRNPVLSAKYFEKASDLGSTAARYHLGLLYRDGIGVDKDEKRALSLLKLASEYGNTSAIIALHLSE